MKKSELKQLIRECIAEANLPARNQLPPDIREFAEFISEKINDRVRKTGHRVGLENAIVDMVVHKMMKDGWAKGGADSGEDEFYNEKGQVDPNGSFDAGGHMVRHPANR